MLASALELGGGVFTSVVFLVFVAVHSLQLNMWVCKDMHREQHGRAS